MEPDHGIPRHQGPQAAGPAPEFLETFGKFNGLMQINQGWDGDDWDGDSYYIFFMIRLYDQVLSLL